MYKTSAGLLMYRRGADGLEVLLAHPGGPFFAKKDLGAWTIPKGEFDPATEAPLAAARREFIEETGFAVGAPLFELGTVTQAGGKRISAWAFAGEGDPAAMVSNTFEMQWPPGSGKRQSFAEIDRVQWFDPQEARKRINPAQRGFIDALEARLAASA